MSLLLSYLLSAGGAMLLSTGAVLWLLARPRSTAARRFLVAVIFLYSAASIRAVPWVLSRPLVRGFQQYVAARDAGGSTAIVLLGAGSFTVHGWYQRLGLLDQESAARVLEAAHLFRLLDSAWIISSGGAADGIDLEPCAVTMREALVRLGIPAERIVLESSSRDTRDEATLVAPMLRRLKPDRVVLVTTDIHMPRALAAFRAEGIDASPAVARDPLNSQSRLRSFVPTTEGLRFTKDVVHEYVGLVEYGLRGWLRF